MVWTREKKSSQGNTRKNEQGEGGKKNGRGALFVLTLTAHIVQLELCGILLGCCLLLLSSSGLVSHSFSFLLVPGRASSGKHAELLTYGTVPFSISLASFHMQGLSHQMQGKIDFI